MSDIPTEEYWEKIDRLVEEYRAQRATYIQEFKNGAYPFASGMEMCYYEAGRILFEMMGEEPLPTEDELFPILRNPPRSQKKIVKPPRKGFVYLMKNTRNGFIKIGFSRDPQYREQTLQAEDPQIETILTFEGTLADEEALHEKFAAYRVRGEWFKLTEEDIKKQKAEFRLKGIPGKCFLKRSKKSVN